MNNKYLYIIGGVVLIGAMYLILNPSEEVSNPLVEKKEFKNLNSIHNEKISLPINNKSHKETMIENENINNFDIKSKEKINSKKITFEKKENSNSTFVINGKNYKNIETFIEENDLQPIQQVGDVEIFAKNLPKKNEFAPPMPPTLIKVKFKDKSEVIPLNTNLINSNKKIYVVKKDDDKYKEIKEIDTKKLTSFTPPSIGQN